MIVLSNDDDSLCLNEALLRKLEHEFGLLLPNALPQASEDEELLNEPEEGMSDERLELSFPQQVSRYLEEVSV